MKKEVKKEEVVTFAEENSVAKAAEKYGVSVKTVHAWKGKAQGNSGGVSVQVEGEYLVIRIPKRVALREALGGLI